MKYRALRDIVLEYSRKASKTPIEDELIAEQYMAQIENYLTKYWGKNVIEYEVIRDALAIILRNLSSWPIDSMLANDIDWIFFVAEVSLQQVEERIRYNELILSYKGEGEFSLPKPQDHLDDIINVSKERGYNDEFIHFFIDIVHDIINKFTYDQPYARTPTFYYREAGSIIGRCGPILRKAIMDAGNDERKFPIKLSFVASLLEMTNSKLFLCIEKNDVSRGTI